MYNAAYYQTFNPPYNHTEPHWRRFFGALAQFIKMFIRPTSALDVGCAKGFLVEQLRLRNVKAFGFDLSHYAVKQTLATPFCWVASATDWTARNVDLITCIEVLEHLPETLALKALDNICQHAQRVLFSSTCSYNDEPTHVNVHPARYWMQAFGKRGFVRNERRAPTLLIPWSLYFERRS